MVPCVKRIAVIRYISAKYIHRDWQGFDVCSQKSRRGGLIYPGLQFQVPSGRKKERGKFLLILKSS